jgi:hypothetical protein
MNKIRNAAQTVFLLILALAAVLAWTSNAHAEDVTASPIAQQNIAIASAYWGVTIPGYHVEVAALQSTAPKAVGEAGEPGNWQRIAPEFWAAKELRILCVIETHEYGHSLGHEHVTDPTNVMYPDPSENSVPGCDVYPSCEEEAQVIVQAEQNAEIAALSPKELAIYHKILRKHKKHHKIHRKKRRHR